MCLAIPGEVVDVCERDGIRYGDVRFGGIVREVCLHAHPTTQPGDFVLVHVGFAIARIDREEAERAWKLLEELGVDESAEGGASQTSEIEREGAA